MIGKNYPEFYPGQKFDVVLQNKFYHLCWLNLNRLISGGNGNIWEQRFKR